MQILLLAAGRGTRMGSMTEEMPKTLLQIASKPLCIHIIDSLVSFKPERIFVVGGFCLEKFSQALKPYGSPVTLLANPDYRKGSILSLLCGRKWMSQSFCIFNSDHYYSTSILARVFSTALTCKNVTVVCDFDRPLSEDDMKVDIGPGGRLLGMSKNLSRWDAGYTGITIVPLAMKDFYWEKAVECLKEEGEAVPAEMVLNFFAASGGRVDILDASGSCWFEVDTPEDLARAETIFSKIRSDLSS